MDKVTIRTSNGERILIKKWNTPSENEREEIHNVDNRPERVPRDAKDERTVTFGPTTRLKIQVEKDTIEEREEKRNSQEEYAAQGLQDDYYESKTEAKAHQPYLLAQSIACESRAGLLSRSKRGHQQPITQPPTKPGDTNKTPQFLPNLNLKTGESNSNFLATAHANEQLLGDLGQGWASNKIAPQIGREYRILENMAWATGVGTDIDPLTLERVTLVKTKQTYKEGQSGKGRTRPSRNNQTHGQSTT